MKISDLIRYALGVCEAATMLAGCGGTQTPGQPTQLGLNALPFSHALTRLAVHRKGKAEILLFVYVANIGSNNVYGYSADGSGALTQVSGSPFAADDYPEAVAVDPTGTFAYVTTATSSDVGTVSGYSINVPSGALTPLNGSPFGAGGSFYTLGAAVDPKGKFIYVTSAPESAGITAYAINASGQLNLIPGSPFQNHYQPQGFGVAVDPTASFFYAANDNQRRVRTFEVYAYSYNERTGKPRLVQKVETPGFFGSPQGVAVDPRGKFLYLANYDDNDISAYAINPSSGMLTPVAGSPFGAGNLPFDVAVDPSGRFVYVTNVGSDDVSAYTINKSSGALTPVAGSPFPAGSGPLGVAIDPAGSYVFVANNASNNVSAYSIDSSNGALIQVAGSPFAAGTGPVSIATCGVMSGETVCKPPPL